MNEGSASLKKFKSLFKEYRFYFPEETYEKFFLYYELLLKWQDKINLISPLTLSNSIERHFIDSLQLAKLIPENTKTLIDLGSGAGFPGMVLGISSGLQVTLVEADSRKCVFLGEVSRITQTPVKILNQRIEKVEGFTGDLITSRALADLEKLIEFSKPFTHEKSWCIFHKGKKVDQEIEKANKRWKFSYEKIRSLLSKEEESFLIKIRDIKKRDL